MGVHGLWELLAPVGRRVSVETLAGKKVAIDASIWMIQFMKAMRDEKGDMVRNAHLLGFFRRICKLLYLRTRPVFVFDGGTPALKRRTVIARRRQRENAQAKIRKTAEKLLLNHIKAMRVKELAVDLERQRQENDIKGKTPILGETEMELNTKGHDVAAQIYRQEELDEMLAASLAAEEDGFTADVSTSGTGIPDDEDDENEDEEMMLPEMHGKIDPAVLAALPPSMQLDLLVQMRERLMAENRQKYQKVKKAPERFSELQIQAYLKTVAFRREIDEVQKSATGRGVGGVQTSRIASEANREFIFSSSFTGNRQALTSTGQEGISAEQSQPLPLNSSANAINEITATKTSSATTGSTVDETAEAFHDDVETYLDERGRLRVSRVRALGIRMTRDLQRNLDLIKEIEQEKVDANQENTETATGRNLVHVLGDSSNGTQPLKGNDKNNDGVNDETGEPAVKSGTSMEITFEDIGEHGCGDDDGDLFNRLVGEDPVMNFSIDNSVSVKQSLYSTSDCEIDGVIQERGNVLSNDIKVVNEPSQMEGGMSDEDEVEWEEGSLDIPEKASLCLDKSQKTFTKGSLEEEAEFQEAIRRSLEDMVDCRIINEPCEDEESRRAGEKVIKDIDWEPVHEDKNKPEVEAPSEGFLQPPESPVIMNTSGTNSSEAKSVMYTVVDPGESNLEPNFWMQGKGGSGALPGEMPVGSGAPLEEKKMCKNEKQLTTCSSGADGQMVNELMDFCGRGVAHSSSSSSAVTSSFDNLLPNKLPEFCFADAQHDVSQATLDANYCDTTDHGKLSAKDSTTDGDTARNLAKDKVYGDSSIEKEELTRSPAFRDKDEEEHEVTKAHLEDELLILGKEREELGSEQRKLERNAESVSSEMFAECQELLQMFGLPYIIAPMEAEAQCAYMELANLVDGVVTDDSDVLLFGARSVYKNIFDDRKYVETYFMKDIENELGLDREKLVRMALLLGSDYTEGVSGIGIVNAIEVVNAFPEKDGLREFREWIESPDPTILGKFDVKEGSNSNKKVSKDGDSSSNTEGISTTDKNGPHSVDDTQKIKQIFMDKHRNVSKNWHIPSSFPSDAVISAYTFPQVDNSTEPFSWGKPDLFVLRKLCWEKFGWGTSKADELLLPVLKEYNKHETQLRLEAFYTFNERFAKIRSRRIKKAVQGIAGKQSSRLMDDTVLQKSRSGKKRKVNPTDAEANRSGEGSTGLEKAGNGNQINTVEKITVKQSKGRQTKEKSNSEQFTMVESCLKNSKKSNVRGRARGRGQQNGRGRRKNNSCSGDTETSSDAQSVSEKEQEMQFEKSEESRQVRRSERPRKVVSYTVSDEFDDPEKEGHEGENCDEDSIAKESFVDQADIGLAESNANEVGDLEVGGGFCVDEMECENSMDKINASQNDCPSIETQLSKEYLEFGGGFCFDEEGEEMEGIEPPSSPMRTTFSIKSDPFDRLDDVQENQKIDESVSTPTRTSDGVVGGRSIGASDTEPNMNDVIRSDCSKASILLNNTEEDEIGSLRAMPNLRRKKKKI
ncbi:DNA repair protein UVH3 [Forsythia ovata]|uniref:DNA repair protein UVH3 n=1 Tax=Forsythia ovata TaxID=205694 RepID=A0ABD1UEN3_9LAMI